MAETPYLIWTAVLKEITSSNSSENRAFTVDDIAVAAFLHCDIKMRQYPQYPDARKVAACLFKQMLPRGEMLKSGRNLYRLGKQPTERKRGRAPRASQTNRAFLDKLQDSDAALLLRKGRVTEIGPTHAMQFYGAHSYPALVKRSEAVKARLADIRTGDPNVRAEELNFLCRVIDALAPYVERARKALNNR